MRKSLIIETLYEVSIVFRKESFINAKKVLNFIQSLTNEKKVIKFLAPFHRIHTYIQNTSLQTTMNHKISYKKVTQKFPFQGMVKKEIEIKIGSFWRM